MNLLNILNHIEQTDPEVFEKLDSRRGIFKNFGSKVAIASLPFALGALLNKAYGKATSVVGDALNFALELEYLEYNFYHAVHTGRTYNVSATDDTALITIEAHEKAHVNFLRNAINAAGITPYTPPHYTGNAVTGDPYSPLSYDFTQGGALPVYTDYATFLTVAQAFEDTGVRAYKGQAGNLQSNHDYLTAALKIHSVEARHASHIRYMRRLAGVADNPKPWITGSAAPAAVVQGNYNGENNTTQGGVVITTLNGVNGNISTNAATEAFDEPLDKTTVTGLVSGFFLP